MSAALAPPPDGGEWCSKDFRVMTREQRRAYVDAFGLPQREPGRARWLVAPIVGPLIERLSQGELGWSNATAPALRVMVFVDTGYIYGERSIPRFIGREVKSGKLRHKRIPPGSYFSRTKRWTRNGTQLNRYETEAERRERLWRAKVEKRQARRDRGRQLEADRQERARCAREERRSRRRASLQLGAELVRPGVDVDEAPALVGSDAQLAIAGVLAIVANPPALAPLGAPARATEPPPATRRDREAEIQRALAWALEHDRREPKPPDDDDGTPPPR